MRGAREFTAGRGRRRRHPGRVGILVACLIAAAVSVAAAAVPKVAVVTSRDIAPYRAAKAGFIEVMDRSGMQYRIVELSTETDDRGGRGIIERIRATRPDLILTIGSAATRTVGENIRDIPIIFSLVLENAPGSADERGMGTNMTGASMDIPLRTQFKKLQEALPSAHRFGVMFNPEETGKTIEQAAAVAEELGIELVQVPVRDPAEVLAKIETIEGQVDLLWSVADSTVFTPQSVRHILLNTLRNKIPFIGLSPSYVRAGALLSLSCDYEDVGRQSAELAIQVLNGSSPQQVPVTVPRQVLLYLNMNTAKQLEVEISQQVQESAEIIGGS